LIFGTENPEQLPGQQPHSFSVQQQQRQRHGITLAGFFGGGIGPQGTRADHHSQIGYYNPVVIIV